MSRGSAHPRSPKESAMVDLVSGAVASGSVRFAADPASLLVAAARRLLFQGASIGLILLTTCPTLRADERGEKLPRVKQIANWLGADLTFEAGAGFGGVIIFDKSPAMQNAAVQVPAPSRMSDGDIERRVRSSRPMEHHSLPLNAVTQSYWTNADHGRFAAAQQAEFGEVPQFTDSTIHIVAGAPALSPDAAYAALLEGRTVLDLAEGLQLRRVRLTGAARIIERIGEREAA